MKKLLLYFGDEKNPASIVAQNVENEFDKIEIPNDYSMIKKFVMDSDFSKYDKIIMLGVKPKSFEITIEIYAHNYYSSNKIKLLVNGEEILKTKYNFDELIYRLKNNNIKISISENAGTYYCNCSYYWILHKYPTINIIFIHLSDELEVINFLKSKLNDI
jgi:pyrrolidone-carboxylate peptidase